MCFFYPCLYMCMSAIYVWCTYILHLWNLPVSATDWDIPVPSVSYPKQWPQHCSPWHRPHGSENLTKRLMWPKSHRIARRDDGEFVISYCCHWCDCCHVCSLCSFIFWTSYELHAWAIPKNPSRNFEPSASQVCATVHGWKCLRFANSEAPSRVQFIAS